jgi:hypothetical protein
MKKTKAKLALLVQNRKSAAAWRANTCAAYD